MEEADQKFAKYMRALQDMEHSEVVSNAIHIGKELICLQNHKLKEIRDAVRKLLIEWQSLVDQWKDESASSAVTVVEQSRAQKQSCSKDFPARKSLLSDSLCKSQEVAPDPLQAAKDEASQKRASVPENTVDKLAAAKRKLQEQYSVAKRQKSQHVVKVLKIQELPKESSQTQIKGPQKRL